MLYLFAKEYHRVISQPNWGNDGIFITERIYDWLEGAWAKYRVNILKFTYDWTDYFWDNEDLWPSTHRRKSQSSWRKYDYDIKQKSNLFNLDSLYRRMPKKPFIKGRKQEFEILMMYNWLHSLEGDGDGYWQEYLDKILPSLGNTPI
jgi:hypothetical protein